MDLKTNTAAFSLLRQILNSETATISHINTRPQKPRFIPSKILQPFERTAPETEGVSSSRIASFIQKLRNDNELDPHGLIVLRNGKILCQTAFGAYQQDIWHVTHSACKSITCLAIGMLGSEGKLHLEDKLIDLLPEHVTRLGKLTHKGITLRHLLTMTSGVLFNEAGSVTETNWVKCFMESAVITEPGKTFNYNSMNTYILSAIVKAISGEDLTAYLKPRLFIPLGIENIFWEKCPMGIEKGGWGLYILPEDMAKIGQLVLQKGKWKDRQLISAAWIEDATSAHVHPSSELGNYDYGYQIWVGRADSCFLFNGMFGQNVLGFWDSQVLLVTNSGNNELFQQSNFYQYASAYFGNVAKLDAVQKEDATISLSEAYRFAAKDHHGNQSGLLQTLYKTPVMPRAQIFYTYLNEKSFVTHDTKALSVGVYPLFAQIVQNNYTKGVSGIMFSVEKRKLYMIIAEAGAIYKLPVSEKEPQYTEINHHGEIHQVAVQSSFSWNEDQILVLKTRISYLESSSARLIRFYFYPDRLVTRWSETPGLPCLIRALVAVKERFSIINALVDRNDEEFLQYRMKRVFEPEIIFTEN